MRRLSRLVRLGVGVAATLASFVLPAHAQSAQPVVVGLTLNGVVDTFEASYLKGGIASAAAQHAEAVLLTIDTPGGLDSSMRQIDQAILNSPVPVICYVSPEGARAASAGTFIMSACPVAAMAPSTEIGAAHPVGVSGAIEQQKVTNDAVAYIQSLAKRNNRNQTWVKDAVVNSVSIPASEALRIHVIDLVAPTTQQLLADLNGRTVKIGGGLTTVLHTAGATIQQQNLGAGAAVLHALFTPDLAFIFFYLGLGLIVIELIHPGISVPGIFGVLSLIAAFLAFGELPVQVTGVVLLIASAIFFLLELKHPGVGLFTVGGVATLVFGGLLLFNRSVPNAQVSPWVIAVVAGIGVLFFSTVVNAAMAARRLPKPVSGVADLVGREGVVLRRLAPQGVVQVGHEQWTATSAGEPIAKGTTVRVVRSEGLRLVVEPAAQQVPATTGPKEGNEP